MHVAFVGSYGLWTHHFATELELAERHLRAGDRVTWVTCDRAFRACDTNQSHDELACQRCEWKILAGLRLLSGEVERQAMSTLLADEDRARVDALPRGFTSLTELKAFTFDGLDAGWGALSSAIWSARDAKIDPGSALIDRFLAAGVTSYLATKRLVEGGGIDRVYAFNGRMAPMRGVLRACADAGVPCVIHERGQDVEHYALFDDAMPHKIAWTVRRANEDWETSTLPEDERERVASAWFEGRPKGQMGSWISFVSGQDPEGLPDDWDPARHNIALFTTTEFEFASIGAEWQSPLFETPEAATFAIARGISARAAAMVEAGAPADSVPHLTIRIHPNPDGAGSESVKATLALDLPHVTVLAPTSPVATYGLMRAADVVVTSGSTAGVEATFWGKPSVLAGRGLYAGLGAAHEPATVDELLDMLIDPELGVADRRAALRYGFHQATRGIRFEHFEPTNLSTGTFRGSQIRPTLIQRRLLGLRKRLRRLRRSGDAGNA